MSDNQPDYTRFINEVFKYCRVMAARARKARLETPDPDTDMVNLGLETALVDVIVWMQTRARSCDITELPAFDLRTDELDPGES
ncbi:MAG: hypothetical protein ABI867_08445 [Kofleriaceae bacterium]